MMMKQPGLVLSREQENGISWVEEVLKYLLVASIGALHSPPIHLIGESMVAVYEARKKERVPSPVSPFAR